ncbi:hypothetical protein Y1Q_0012908 [Alligator mississippiensis]|uniref:Uncharacterized protein n=1 Tax=Alligator mississippiensis TaxID=8496 RepID=A0A151P1R9_ALLMI|nr:hypothetical protein Y1Q_0012908 [Alligator mississippiensis]
MRASELQLYCKWEEGNDWEETVEDTWKRKEWSRLFKNETKEGNNDNEEKEEDNDQNKEEEDNEDNEDLETVET